MWSKSRAGIFLLGSVFGSSTSYLLLSWDNYNWKVLQEEKEALSGSHEPEGSSDVRLHEGDLAATDDTLFKYGVPQLPVSLHSYKSHSLAYDRSRKVPLWVAETITKEKVRSKVANRKKSKFCPDPSIPPCYSSANEDYRRSNWSRGHMAPAGDCKHSQDAMDDTFYLTNIVPQDTANNNGYWNRLEMYCRDLIKRFDRVHVITGPLFLPELDPESEDTYVRYQVLGRSRVAVPTHLYKVVLAEGGDQKQASLGVFIVPNKPIDNVDLTRFQVSLEELEAHVGCTFHSELKRDQVQDLCAIDGCKLMSLEKMARAAFTRKLGSASSMQELERVWDELSRSTVKPDSKAKEVFLKRKGELSSDHT